MFLRDKRKAEVDFFSLLGRDFEQILGQIVSIRVKTLSNTNLVASKHISVGNSMICSDIWHKYLE